MVSRLMPGLALEIDSLSKPRRTIALAPLPARASTTAAASTTHYDKYALTYLGGVLLACAVIHARVGTPKLGDTP